MGKKRKEKREHDGDHVHLHDNNTEQKDKMRFFIFLIIFFPEGKNDDEVTSFFYVQCVSWVDLKVNERVECVRRDEDIPHT